MDPDAGIDLLFFFAFLALGAFVVLCQNSLVEFSDQKLRRSAGESPALERIARLMEHPGRLDSAMRSAYTFFHLCAVAFLARGAATLAKGFALFRHPFWKQPLGRLAGSLLIMLLGVFFIMLFSRGIPRRIAARHSDQLAPALSLPAAAITTLFTTLTWLVEKSGILLLALFGVHDLEQQENVTEEEIRMMVDVSEETGGIEAAEKEMILGVFDFADRTVDEIMTHRTDVIAVEEDVSLEELVELVTENGFSRLPVVGEDGLDDIRGILNVKDLLPLVTADRRKKFTVESYLRAPFYVPESTKCRDLFANFNQQKNQIAVVVETLGGAGARCFFAGETWDVASHKVTCVDTNGAGDAFWGAFLSSLRIQGVDRTEQLTKEIVSRAMAYGNAAGGLTVQKKGAIPALPTRAEIEAFLAR